MIHTFSTPNMSLISQTMPEKSGVSKLLWTSNHPVERGRWGLKGFQHLSSNLSSSGALEQDMLPKLRLIICRQRDLS